MPSISATVAVVSGGPSPEADVSRLSAARLIPTLEARYSKAVQLELDHTLPALLQEYSVDVVFPVAHGPVGEDGSLQGLLDIMGVAYVGSGVLASACAMDKSVTKRILQAAGIPLAKDRIIHRRDDLNTCARQCIEYLGKKVILKPLGQGSGIGIQFAEGYEDLRRKLSAGLVVEDQMLVEEFITGREITAGVLDLKEPLVLPVTEITTADGAWYDYIHRYTPGLSEHTTPAALPAAQYQHIQEIALKAHQLLGCRDISRSDFVVPETGYPVLIELNNLPGMTPTSLFPDGAKAAGIAFETLIHSLVDHALSRKTQGLITLPTWSVPQLDAPSPS